MDRRLTQRGEERRRQLMAYAADRFADNGYHPTSVAEIVEGLGVGKGVFYWYFDSKEELLRAILADGQLDLRRRQRAAIAGAEGPMERIERGIRASIEWSLEQRVFFRLFQFAATDDRFADNLRKGEQVAVRDAAKHVADAMAAGEIPDRDPVLLAHAMLGVTTHLVQLDHRGLMKATPEAIDSCVAFCLGGISRV
ncbi:TetR/AcrR family transcriptional regulator [Aquihabitans sp. G128]|uniref:TetR/AcrR family transcriptional regulator n=1 Tax=Aquihabitans sp. G128 TaxID=2849779 RepID=UPI001C241F00|nr:TetR/AcrR family transcriptional regulator [Aquihabitans sp. G128]QXC62297.1 TetR/AcrR family transcriptional regulator [Aquihabitans sp. G128]